MTRKMVLLITMTWQTITMPSAKLLNFTNPAIHSLDGATFMIDGKAIHDIVVVIRKTDAIHIGQKIGAKTVGHYQFYGEKLSIKQLAEVEKTDPNNPNLIKILSAAKHDFIETTKPFMDGMEAAKRLILDLIGEFCERRNRHDSIILSWANAKHGNEAEIFSQAVKSFAEFDIFLEDLTLFLKDLINSCPKAREQYKEWYKKQKMLKAL